MSLLFSTTINKQHNSGLGCSSVVKYPPTSVCETLPYHHCICEDLGLAL